VTAIAPQQTQSITISGSGFGDQAGYSGDSIDLSLLDISGTTWEAGKTGNVIGLAVTSWTDSQIVLTGLTGPYGTNGWCISPGDQLFFNVRNAQSGDGPATYGVVVGAGTDTCGPKITSISAIAPEQTQTITINGAGFGTQGGYNGESPYISLIDNTGTLWEAGHTGNAVGLDVLSWTDSQIVLTGLTGGYGTNGWCIRPGDQLTFSVKNPQSGAGPAYYSIAASGGTDSCTPVITSISAIAPKQTQTITITGAGFGTQGHYTGDSSDISLLDTTGTPWEAGRPGNSVGLAVTSWTDTQIVLSGLSGAYGANGWCIRPGDHLTFGVKNVGTGGGPAYFSVVAGAGGDTCNPVITSVSAIAPEQTQTITITGTGFGTQSAYNGDSNAIALIDTTGTLWEAGRTGNSVGLNVTSWTDTQITLTGFTGAYGTHGWCISPGDQLSVTVRNAQTLGGPAVYPIVVGGGTNTCL
jgi:hypothetical protein